MKLSDSHLKTFQEQGFVLGGRVLTDAQVDVLRSEIQRVMRTPEFPTESQPVRCINVSQTQGAPVWQIVNIWQASEPFALLIRNKSIAADVACLTRAKELRIWHDQVEYKPKDIGGTASWHQDSPEWGGDRPVLTPPTQISAWVALDEVSEENGCLWMVPGSHLWGPANNLIQKISNHLKLPAEHSGRKLRKAACPVPKGYVHFHHGLTWHSSSPNTSGRSRRAIAVHYMPENTRYVADNEHVMKQFVTVGDGEMMAGSAFPQVYPIHVI